MAHYGARSPKRHQGLSNNKWVEVFNRGKLQAKDRKPDPTFKTSHTYTDKNGRRRWQGTKQLKESQLGSQLFLQVVWCSQKCLVRVYHDRGGQLRIYPVRFGVHALRYLPKLKTCGQGCPMLQEIPSGPEIFKALIWEDWQEANLRDVGVYLRGGKSLDLTPAWRAVFPTEW